MKQINSTDDSTDDMYVECLMFFVFSAYIYRRRALTLARTRYDS